MNENSQKNNDRPTNSGNSKNVKKIRELWFFGKYNRKPTRKLSSV